MWQVVSKLLIFTRHMAANVREKNHSIYLLEALLTTKPKKADNASSFHFRNYEEEALSFSLYMAQYFNRVFGWRASGAEPTLVLRTTPTPSKFGSCFWLG
jgi:hypothetical protein